MGKVSQFLWRLFRKATESDEQKEKPTKVTVRQIAKRDYYKTTIRLPAEVVKAYKHAAVERKTTYSYLIEEALYYYLKEVLERKR